MILAPESIDRLPPEARDPVARYAERLEAGLGENLRSIAIFGSATGTDYVPRRSDVNVLVGVRVLGIEALRAARPPSARRGRRRFIAPLLLTLDYIRSSLDTFPVEFLEMRERHILLYGEDLLAGLDIRPEDIRRQCERELKAHLIKLRQAYLEAAGSTRGLSELLGVALTSLLPSFRNILRLKDPAAPRERAAVLAALGPAFSVNPEPMLAVERARERGRMDSRTIDAVFDQFQRELEELTRAVDRM